MTNLVNPYRFGGGAAFAPTDIAGLELWVDASDISTLYQDSAKTTAVTTASDPVGAWVDKSGNGNDLLQATTGNRPDYQTAQINGLATVHSLASGDTWMRAAFTLAQPHSIYLVVSNVQQSTNNHLIGGVTANAGVIFRQISSGLQLYSGSTGPQLTSIAGESMLLRAEFDGASSIFQKNTGTEATGNPGTTAAGGITLLASNASNQIPQDTYVGEVCVYSNVLSSSDRADIQGYLMTKWGL